VHRLPATFYTGSAFGVPASVGRKAISQISLRSITGLRLKWVWQDSERLIRDVSSRVRSSTGRLKSSSEMQNPIFRTTVGLLG